MKFEGKSDPLLPSWQFVGRMFRSLGATSVIILISLWMGSAGYHYLGNLPWVDALLNASMILTGMGPVDEMKTTSGKLFATFYALYSGIAFLTMMAIMLAPLIHRMLHAFHVEEEDDHEAQKSTLR